MPRSAYEVEVNVLSATDVANTDAASVGIVIAAAAVGGGDWLPIAVAAVMELSRGALVAETRDDEVEALFEAVKEDWFLSSVLAVRVLSPLGKPAGEPDNIDEPDTMDEEDDGANGDDEAEADAGDAVNAADGPRVRADGGSRAPATPALTTPVDAVTRSLSCDAGLVTEASLDMENEAGPEEGALTLPRSEPNGDTVSELSSVRDMKERPRERVEAPGYSA